MLEHPQSHAVRWRAPSWPYFGLLAALVASCTAPGDERPLDLRVRFLCSADRLASDRVRVVLHGGSCEGEPLYNELLARGESPAAPPQLAPGTYGFEAVALADGKSLARTCVLETLPMLQPRVTLELASPDCTAPDLEDADAGSAPDGSAVRPTEPAPVLPVPGAPAPEGGVPPAPVPDAGGNVEPPVDTCTAEQAAAGICTPCTRSCGGGFACQNDVCRPLDAGAASCTAVRHAGRAYLFCTDTLTWNTARTRCRDWGFGLVRIDDAAENAFVHAQLGGLDGWLGANDLGPSDVGLQGIDVQLRDVSFGSDTPSCRKVDGAVGEGSWYWASERADVSNDTPLCSFADVSSTSCDPVAGRYTNFNAGEPDNASCTCLGVCLPGEDCALMLGGNGAWSDRSCLRPAAFVCESD